MSFIEDRESTVDSQWAHAPRPALERGACVDRYLIVDELGKGGMGVVYKAFDPELSRPVALKLLNTQSSTSELLRGRLLREAQALARLSHPNVIAVHDVGTFGGDVFIAMEFVEGRTLRRWLAAGDHSQREILDVFLAAGEGLKAAHHAGLVHRDFKPDNVIVGVDGRVRVLDFGLARAASGESGGAAGEPLALDPQRALDETAAERPVARSAESSPRRATTSPSKSQLPLRLPSIADPSNGNSGHDRLLSPLTRTGSVMGTPRFMAPEQRQAMTVDERADQFSFCLSLYEALAGVFPFAGETLAEIEDNVFGGRVQEPPTTARMPRWVHKVLLRGLAVKAQDRHPSMDALLTALRADPGLARRDRLRALAAVALVGAAVVGWRVALHREHRVCAAAESELSGIWDPPRRAAIRDAFLQTGKPYAATAFGTVERAFDDYARAWVGMHVDTCEATHVRHEQSQEMLDLRMTCLGSRLTQLKTLSDVYATADASVVERAAQSAQSLPGLALCADAAALRAPVPPPRDRQTQSRVETVRQAVAKSSALSLAARYEAGLQVARAAVGDAQALHYPPVEAEALLRLGQALGERGEYAEAALALHRAFAAALAGHHERAAADAATGLIQAVGEHQARYEEGDRWAEVAEALIGRMQAKDDQLGWLYIYRSLLREREGKYDEALHDATLALELKQRTLGPDHYSVAASLHQLGNIHESRNEYAQALESYQRALAIDQRTLGPGHPMLAKTLVGMADVVGESGDHERALGMYRRALGDLRRVQADHPDLAMVYNNMGDELQAIGKPREAMEQFAQALAIWEKRLGPSFETTVALNNMGLAQLDLDEPAEGLRYFMRAQEVCEHALGPRHSWCGKNLEGLGEAYRLLGKPDAALDCFVRALAIVEAAHGPKNPQVVPSLLGLGRVELGHHAWANARAPLERALAIRQEEPGDGVELADVRFGLAQALWASDRVHARELAAQARESYVKAGTRRRKELVEATDWIAQHR